VGLALLARGRVARGDTGLGFGLSFAFGFGLGFALALADYAISFGFDGGGATGIFFGEGRRLGCGPSRVCRIFFFNVFRGLEIFFAPLVAADAGLVDGAAVDDYVLDVKRLDREAAEVQGGGLQGIEEQAGDFGIDLAGGEQAHDLHERDLDGVGVLEDGEEEAGVAVAGTVAIQFDALFLKALVKETEAVAAKRGRAALDSVDLEMLTTRDVEKRHSGSYPPVP
jgi:hypothetical protein